MSQFSDALDFIFNRQESVSGGVEIGGLGEIWDLTVTHMWLSIAAMAVASAIAVPIGLYLGHIGKGDFLAINVSNVGRAVPTYALIVLFVAYLGTGFTKVMLALVLLAVPPILTNTFVGMRQVDREIVDSARGMGLSEGQIIRQVELPLALPTIFAGVRISAVNVIATAILAAQFNVLTLGQPIINANVYGDAGRLGAAIVVAVVALVADGGIAALQRAVTPKGIKLAEQDTRRRYRPFNLFNKRKAQTT
ncbi:MAG: ABC transporter permease [Propionibacteriaceae bacterium]